MTPEFAAALRDMRCESLQWEMATTRKVIAAIPETGTGYRPDAKARTALELAWHIVTSEVQLLEDTAALKFAMEERHPQVPGSIAEVVAFYEQRLPAALAAARAMTPEQLVTPVDFYGAFNFPAVVYLGFVESHSMHHRGQLSAYLRPAGGAVPSIYGGSADEPWQPPA